MNTDHILKTILGQHMDQILKPSEVIRGFNNDYVGSVQNITNSKTILSLCRDHIKKHPLFGNINNHPGLLKE